MAVTYNAFITRFPELASAPADVINIELANAARMVNRNQLVEQADDAIGLLAAHRVALRPGGEFARLKIKDQPSRTTYGDQYADMMKHVLPGDRVP